MFMLCPIIKNKVKQTKKSKPSPVWQEVEEIIIRIEQNKTKVKILMIKELKLKTEQISSKGDEERIEDLHY